MCAWRERLHSSIGYLKVSRDHSKERRSSIQGCKSLVKLGSISKEDGVVLGFLNYFFIIFKNNFSKRDPGSRQWCPGTSERKEGSGRCRQTSPMADRPVLIPLEVSEEGREDAEEELAGIYELNWPGSAWVPAAGRSLIRRRHLPLRDPQ